MARAKKFETIIHPRFDVSVDVYYHRTGSHFTANCYGTAFQETDINILKQKIISTIEANNELKWLPVLVVQYRPGKNDVEFQDYSEKHPLESATSEVHIQIERIYVAETTKGTFKYVPWAIAPEYRSVNIRDWSSPERGEMFGSEEGRWWIRASMPYSEEMWQGLLALAAGIGKIQNAIIDLLNPETSDYSAILRAGENRMKGLPASVFVPGNEGDVE